MLNEERDKPARSQGQPLRQEPRRIPNKAVLCHFIALRRPFALILAVFALTIFPTQSQCFHDLAFGGQNRVPGSFLLVQAAPPAETSADPALPSQPLPRHTITDIEIDAGSPMEERVIFSLEGVAPPKTFFIDGDPLRLVCDFPEADIGPTLEQDIRPKGKMIQRVRVGVHKQPKRKVRVVFELAPGRDYEIDEYFRPEESRYELLVRPAGGIAPSGNS